MPQGLCSKHFLTCLLKCKLSTFNTATSFHTSCWPCLGLSFPLCKNIIVMISDHHTEKLLQCQMEDTIIAMCYSFLTFIIVFWEKEKSGQDFKDVWHYKDLHHVHKNAIHSSGLWFRCVPHWIHSSVMLISYNWIKHLTNYYQTFPSASLSESYTTFWLADMLWYISKIKPFFPSFFYAKYSVDHYFTWNIPHLHKWPHFPKIKWKQNVFCFVFNLFILG